MKSGRIEGTEVVIFAGLATEIIAGDESKVTVMRIKVTPKFGAPPHISYDEDKTFLCPLERCGSPCRTPLSTFAPGNALP